MSVTRLSGHVDGFIGSYLNGWAAMHPGDHACLVEVMDEDGVSVGSGRASRNREDLASLGFGRCDYGFRIPIEKFGSGQQLHVFVEGVELPGSPIQIGADCVDGYFEILRGSAIGWITRRHDSATAAEIHIRLSEDTEVGHVVVTQDDRSSDRFFKPCRFEIPFPPSCFGRDEFIAYGYVDDVLFGTAIGKLTLDGYLDVVSPDFCSGWLLSPSASAYKLEVIAFRDGEMVGSAPCDFPRSDLREKYPDSWRCGFMIRFDPPDTNLTALSELSLRLEDSPLELLHGPFLVGRRTSFIAVAKQVAALSHRADAFLTVADRALFQDIMRNYLHTRRHGDDYTWIRSLTSGVEASGRPINILIPIYKGVAITEACIRSILECRGPEDRLILIADQPPEAEMNTLLERFRKAANVVLLKNKTNLGFVGAINRGLDVCSDGDVLLLNSDTYMFPGGLDALRGILHSESDIATVTAISNNATIFSYPHPELTCETLNDVSWEEIAEIALKLNRDMKVEVPTGHGFCMLIRREVLDRLGHFNETFGRGYGEENEFCLRATDLGFRHVAAAGVFVEHRESISFGDEKADLISANLPQLEAMFPEYTPTIMQFEQTDPMRSARWELDCYRLDKTRKAGIRFVLTVENWLGGGTEKAVADIGNLVGYGDRWLMRLSSTQAGLLQLECERLGLKAIFDEDEYQQLMRLLEAADVDLVLFHQLLGLGEDAIRSLGRWAASRNALCYAHDFYAICPRATLINAVNQYCGLEKSDVCQRCVKLGGSHEASRLSSLHPEQHRALFRDFLNNMSNIVTPSRDTMMYFQRVFPELKIRPIPHPTSSNSFPHEARQGSRSNIVLLGAIGPHKGSQKLLEIASRALLTHAHLRFTIIGYTDIDPDLKKLSNVHIHGRYKRSQLPNILDQFGGTAALFLNTWPETFSYTLSEAVEAGLLPIVPDIGAPAERIRDAGFGIIYPFPIDAAQVLHVLDKLEPAEFSKTGNPRHFYTDETIPSLRLLLT